MAKDKFEPTFSFIRHEPVADPDEDIRVGPTGRRGATGPRGETGSTGPTGPPYSDWTEIQIEDFYVLSSDPNPASFDELGDEEVWKFDDVVDQIVRFKSSILRGIDLDSDIYIVFEGAVDASEVSKNIKLDLSARAIYEGDNIVVGGINYFTSELVSVPNTAYDKILVEFQIPDTFLVDYTGHIDFILSRDNTVVDNSSGLVILLNIRLRSKQYI